MLETIHILSQVVITLTCVVTSGVLAHRGSPDWGWFLLAAAIFGIPKL